MTPFVRLWIWISAFASLAGWGLSAAGQLNRTGYTVAFAAFAVFIFFQRKDLGFTESTVHSPQSKTRDARWPTRLWTAGWRLWARFRRPLPLGFAGLAVLIFLGGAIYPPTHWNAVTYHMPRVLQWLAAGKWHWIHTPVERMNYAGCDFEWLTAPLLLFTNSDRGLFLVNLAGFLLLPGLIFSVFTRLGVRARAAWHWMWLFPTGCIFLLQAGSAGNDAISAVYALAAVDFAFRAGQSRRPGDLWLAVLAAALMTGTKPVSLPLLLPWAIVMATSGAWRAAGEKNFPSRVAGYLPLAAVAAVISFLPIAVMNKIHSGGWLGTSLEVAHVEMAKPLTGVAGNLFQLALHNFTPPLFPLAGWWNRHCAGILPQSWIADFQPGFSMVGELPDEDWAGIGFGLSVLLAVSVVTGFFVRAARPPSALSLQPSALLLLAPWLALLFFCAKSAMNTPARLIAPYYPLLLPLLLAGAGQSHIVRRRWWRVLAGGVVMLAFLVLALSPDRPALAGPTTFCPGSPRSIPNSHLISRALDVYTVYSNRSDPLASRPPAAAAGPPGRRLHRRAGRPRHFVVAAVRFAAGGAFSLTDPPERFRKEHIEYAVVGGMNLEAHGLTVENWLQKSGAELVATTNATLKVSEGPAALVCRPVQTLSRRRSFGRLTSPSFSPAITLRAAAWTVLRKASSSGFFPPCQSAPNGIGSKPSRGSTRTFGCNFIFGTPTVTPMP